MVKSQQMSQLSHAQFPLRRHPNLLVDHRRAGRASVADSRGADAERLTGSGGRLHFGIGGRLQIGTVAGFKSGSVAGLRRNSQKNWGGHKDLYVALTRGEVDTSPTSI